MLVTSENFEEFLPQIEKELKNCVFIAIDCEFSGLVAKDSQKNSLFDTNNERYQKLKENMKSFIPIQVGISIFNFIIERNTYESKTYTFYLLPRSFGFGGNIVSSTTDGTIESTSDIYYLFQSTSIQFLCKYQFDFNKLFYKGINYMSLKQETEYKNQLNDCKHSIELVESIPFVQRVQDSLSIEDETTLNCELKNILQWYQQLQKQSTIDTYNKYVIQNKNLIYSVQLMYLLKKEIKRRYHSTLKFIHDHDGSIYIKLTDADTETTNNDKNIELELELINKSVGFTKLYKLVKKYNQLKKPIIGHNLYLDLLIMYENFEGNLPRTYNEFKLKIHEQLPNIYDTKYLSNQLLKTNFIPKEMQWNYNALHMLYKFFKDGKGRHIVFNSPIIECVQQNTENDYNQSINDFHDAGFDAYCTGYCFIRLAHIFVGAHYETVSINKTITSTEHLSIINKHKNCLNLIRGNVPYIKLDGPDPISDRPSWLYVKYKSNSNKLFINKPIIKKLNIKNITNTLGKYGSIDVKMLNKNEALVAVGSHKCANDILKQFKRNRQSEYIITKYNPIRHSPVIKTYLWSSGCVVTGGLIAWTIYKLMN